MERMRGRGTGGGRRWGRRTAKGRETNGKRARRVKGGQASAVSGSESRWEWGIIVTESLRPEILPTTWPSDVPGSPFARAFCPFRRSICTFPRLRAPPRRPARARGRSPIGPLCRAFWISTVKLDVQKIASCEYFQRGGWNLRVTSFSVLLQLHGAWECLCWILQGNARNGTWGVSREEHDEYNLFVSSLHREKGVKCDWSCLIM